MYRQKEAQDWGTLLIPLLSYTVMLKGLQMGPQLGAPMRSRGTSQWDGCTPIGCSYSRHRLSGQYTEKNIFPFPFELNGIWSWWQFSFDFKPNGFPFGSKLKGKLSPRSYPIHFERKCRYSLLIVASHDSISEIYLEIKSKLDCNNLLSIDLEPNGNQFGSKSVWKW